MAYLTYALFIWSIISVIINFIEFNNLIDPLLLSSIPLIKPKRLKNSEKQAFTVTDDLKQILVGLLLGDLHARNRHGNTRFVFKQGLIHEDYIHHLYAIFNSFCPSEPKINKSLPDIRTGKIYDSIYFSTYTLPCFNELYNLFYSSGIKVIQSNICDYITPLSLAYWISDDGSINKIGRYVTISTESFKLEEVEFLIEVLNKKFHLNCYKSKNGNAYKIVIPSYSVATLQKLLSPHMPPMMKHKIGL